MPVHLVVITNTDGLPLFFQTDLRLEVDPTIFAGFLAAAASFGQAARADLVMTDLSLGELRLHFHMGEKALTVLGTKVEGQAETEKIITEFKDLPRYQKLAKLLSDSFHQIYDNEIDNWDGRVDTFDDFETTIALILGSEARLMEHEFLKLLAKFTNKEYSKGELVDAIWALLEEPEE